MAEGKKVTRIKAKDEAPKKSTAVKATKAKTAKVKAPKKVKKQGKVGKFFSPVTGYFKGAWEELKLVRWPDRKSAWGLTLAVILFSVFFLGLIILLDMLFKYIFELIIT